MSKFGVLTGDAVGREVKEAVARATHEIRLKRFDFESQNKEVDYKKGEDFVTSADKSAQKMYTRFFKESFPDYGIIGEEDGLRQEPGELGLWFTVDPLDGTKAFIRHQSHGISTMVGLVRGNEIIGVWIGDIMTKEIYYFRPGSNTVHRLKNLESYQKLSVPSKIPLKEQYVLLKTHPKKYSEGVVDMTDPGTGLFKDINVQSGSIGTMFAQLWKKEVGAIILEAGFATPWDRIPIIGISQKLGYKFMRYDGTRNFEIFDPEVSMDTIKVPEHIIIHERNIAELLTWTANYNRSKR